jgi:hypothetical protein
MHEDSLSDSHKTCAEKGLSTKGQKATLVSRLQQDASSRPSTTSQPSDTTIPSTSMSKTSTYPKPAKRHTNDTSSVYCITQHRRINNGNCQPISLCCCECIAMFSDLAKRKFASDSKGLSSRSSCHFINKKSWPSTCHCADHGYSRFSSSCTREWILCSKSDAILQPPLIGCARCLCLTH